MKYQSTRGGQAGVEASQAIIQGLAGDGGLFVPDSLPKVDMAFIESLKAMSYEERAFAVLRLFLTDYTDEELRRCISSAYGGGKFDTEKCAPVALPEGGRSKLPFAVLELWHGPTSAFKDMALQLLPRLLATALPKNGVEEKVLILVATSGDTGKAALEGFKDVPQTKIQVFYPDGGVSRIQKLQMVTQEGGNVSVYAVKGNFDAAQSGVKEIFGDAAFKEQLARQGVRLSSANSINWGRLAPQIVYYFSAYADLLSLGRLQPGEEVDFSVPTGNFGDILAGYYAKLMGLPVHRLICASNSNNVLTDFLQTGKYDRKRPFYKTITPSMDILISSNLERLLYEVTGRDAKRVAKWMQELAEQGHYEIESGLLAEIRQTFWADWSNDDDTMEAIGSVYHEKNYVLDPHSAVAWDVARKYKESHSADQCPLVVVSTASPYKFNRSVLLALDEDTSGLSEFQLLKALHETSDLPIPRGLAALQGKTVLHESSCTREGMQAAVADFAVK